MALFRRKISAVLNDLHNTIDYLLKFDDENQTRFSATKSLSKRQLHLMTEAIFLRCFRSYERFLRDIFILYTFEKQPSSRKKVVSYLKAKNFLHSEQILKSDMNYIDWGNPDITIKRATIYLKNGYPLKEPLAFNKEKLQQMRRIRNQIAHDSREALEKYKTVLISYYGTLPLNIPEPGKYLLEVDKDDNSIYLLKSYLKLIYDIAIEMT
jgi:hypothetical protein